MEDINPDLPYITFVIHDMEGGIPSMNHQIIENAEFTAYFNVHIILWRMIENPSKNFCDSFSNVQEVTKFYFSKNDNYYHTLKSFNKLLNKWPGSIITNDGFELQALERFGTSSVIFSIVHDFYNLKLAIISLDIVDYFLCHNETFTKALISSGSLNNRVYYLPHGVRVKRNTIKKSDKINGRLKIVSISRLVETKGVMRLFEIDELLLKQDVNVDWVVVGSGDMEAEMKKQWKEKKNIIFYKPNTNAEVLNIAQTGDIFISPSTFEGYGIALLEAMSCGLVPIIHRLPVGIYSLVPESVGFTINLGDLNGFANSIKTLNECRELLINKSMEAQKFVYDNYSVGMTANYYLETIRKNGFPKVNKNIKYKKVSSFGVLDQKFIPNQLTRLLKKLKITIGF